SPPHIMIDPAIIKLARTETNESPLRDTEPFTVIRFIRDTKQILNKYVDSSTTSPSPGTNANISSSSTSITTSRSFSNLDEALAKCANPSWFSKSASAFWDAYGSSDVMKKWSSFEQKLMENYCRSFTESDRKSLVNRYVWDFSKTASTAHLELIAANQLLSSPYDHASLKEFFVHGCTDSKWKRKVQDLSFSGNNTWDSTSVTIEQIIKKMDSYSSSNSVDIQKLANDVTKTVRTDLQKEFGRIANRGENRPNRNTHLLEWTLTEGESVGHYLPDASASDLEFEVFINTSLDLANDDAREKNEDGPNTKQKLAFRQDIRNYRRNPE
ncbi:hypothetical protein HDU76_012087, partial [Blyttiomyces sp. JEL0837]